MGRTKDIFIELREIMATDVDDCSGDCLNCIKQCPITMRDIEDAIKLLNEGGCDE